MTSNVVRELVRRNPVVTAEGQSTGHPSQLGRDVVINLAPDIYLELGSIKETSDAVNRSGYRTKSYESRRGNNGQSHRSGASSVQHIYSLSGLVHCKRCGAKIDGESGGEQA